MNQPVFADSYYFLALLSEKDEAHERAITLAHSLQSPIVTSVWVLVELADGAASPSRRQTCAAFVRALQQDRSVTIVPPAIDLFHRGLTLYERRPDKAWSLTDCISFVIMDDLKIHDALTGDHHFKQAGFNALM